MEMLKLGKVAERIRGCKNTARNRVKEGLLTRPVKFGPSISVWPEEEVDAIVNARIAGADDAEVRELVAQLHARRAELKPTIRATVRDSAKKENDRG
jgi:prophage regulatory protein